MIHAKTILITGATRGIGLETSRLMLEKSMRVILLDREGTDAAKRELVADGFAAENIEAVTLDLADADAIERRVPKLPALQEGLFGLVNNASIQPLKSVTSFSSDEIEAVWRVNMLAPILMIRACLPFLKKSRGSVVNLGSTSDVAHYRLYSLYGASKSFLKSFSQHAARELGPEGVRINVVSPGGVDTPMMRQIMSNGTFTDEEVAAAPAQIPIEQRWGTPREVAETIYFALTGPAYLHAADLRVHGGAE